MGACLGAVLWAGCATQPETGYVTMETRPVDLTKLRPDTHPELRTGLINAEYPMTVVDWPKQRVVVEASGALP